ncbi:MAG: hypothetical protein KZQ93_20950 [Candidatus Thiodiazotropha sp. (ex Monitilora ramsayi)]|nr:hypothetical protein [Candidatus Thiodiazotropha sp. (ex Monitilora ramsayi)]
MKRVMMGLIGLLMSGPLMAHVGEHHQTGWFSVVTHLLSEHGFQLFLLLAVVLGALALRRVFRV